MSEIFVGKSLKNFISKKILKEELVLAIAEAAQNIVKHAFKNAANANELMVVQISCENNKLQIAFYDRGTPVDPKKLNIGKLIMLNLVD